MRRGAEKALARAPIEPIKAAIFGHANLNSYLATHQGCAHVFIRKDGSRGGGVRDHPQQARKRGARDAVTIPKRSDPALVNSKDPRHAGAAQRRSRTGKFVGISYYVDFISTSYLLPIKEDYTL